MARIEQFLPHLLKVEGGISNSKSDNGGLTKWGVTDKVFKSVYPHTGQTSVVSMTYDQCEYIYKTYYWSKCRADEIKNQSFANLFVDFAVNSGVSKAVTKVQHILKITEDGFCGPKTITAINSADPQKLFNDLKQVRLTYYNSIVALNPSQAIFLKGWKSRLQEYQFNVL